MHRLSGNKALCPVIALEKMRNITRAKGSDSLFCFESNSRLISLSSIRFHSLLRTTICHANIATINVSVPSFRRGAATYAASLVIPADQLKSQGNWRSDCYRSYISLDLANRVSFSSKVSSAISAFNVGSWSISLYGFLGSLGSPGHVMTVGSLGSFSCSNKAPGSYRWFVGCEASREIIVAHFRIAPRDHETGTTRETEKAVLTATFTATMESLTSALHTTGDFVHMVLEAWACF